MEQVLHKRYVLLIYAGLALATIIAFEPVRHNDFVSYDDDAYVTENPHVNVGLTRESVIWAFTSPHGDTSYWHPLTWLSHMLDCELFGLDPFWHHMSNLLFHVVNTLLLFWIFKRMTGAVWLSGFVAAAFALHPLHVESVVWAAERKDLLSGFFWILTMAAYIRYAQRCHIGWYLLVVSALCLALMAKPMVVTLPFVLLLLDYWPLGRLKLRQPSKSKSLQQFKATKISYQRVSFWQLIIEKIPLFVLVGILSVVTFVVQRNVGAMRIAQDLPLSFRISNALVSYIKYIGKTVYPKGLAVLYPFQRAGLPRWQPIVSFIILACISFAVIYLAKKKRYLLVGWLWYLGTLVPVIGLVQAGGQTMADRYTYLPLIGVFIMVAWSAAELSAKWRYQKIVVGITISIVLAILLICTRKQVSRWQNNFTLYKHAIAVTKNNYVMHNNYADALLRDGKVDEAIINFEEAIRINPFYSNAYRNLGKILLAQDKLDRAIMCFTKILSIRTDWPDVYYYLGLAYAQQGKYEPAIKNYKEALRINPDFADAHNELGPALVRLGNYEEAIQHYSEALRLKPNWVEPMNNLAWALATAEDGKFRNPDEAVRLAERACELTRYKQPELLDTLAVAYAATGSFGRAIETSEKAIKLAEESGRKELTEEIQKHLQLYRSGRPYIHKQSVQDDINP